MSTDADDRPRLYVHIAIKAWPVVLQLNISTMQAEDICLENCRKSSSKKNEFRLGLCASRSGDWREHRTLSGHCQQAGG